MTEALKPLFNAEQFFRAAHLMNAMNPDNAPQLRAKPRASGILDCARSVVYSMTNTPPSNPEADTDHRDQAFSNEDNRRSEDISVEVIKLMGIGLEVHGRQLGVPETHPTTGHPDGHFEFSDPEYDKDDGTLYATVPVGPDGLKWGFEHKKLGRYSFLEVFKKGLLVAKPGYVAQAMGYGIAFGWDVVQFVILAEDASSMRYEANQARRQKDGKGDWANRPDWNPKVQLPVLDLRPLYGMFPLIQARAEALSAAVANGKTGDDIQPEYDGKVRFPCNEYCDQRDRCRIATQVAEASGKPLTVIPRTPLNAG